MIRRFYVHNFRCLENFELLFGGRSSTLLIGNNGSGKSSVRLALEVLQRAARGSSRLRELVTAKDFSLGRSAVPMRFEVEVDLPSGRYEYALALELPQGFKEMRVRQERLSVDGKPALTRELAQVTLSKPGQESPVSFSMDWHLVALPVVQQGDADPIGIFRRWLSHMVLLNPAPSLITGGSNGETLLPSPSMADFGEWFTGFMANYPAAYTRVDAYLKQRMPDLDVIENLPTGPDSRAITLRFSAGESSYSVPFADLSDGEKCFLISALVVAACGAQRPLFCFWDEPGAHLALSEAGHFVVALRREFEASGGQLVVTSHSPEAIRRFSNENTLLLHRRSHLEPTVVRPLEDLTLDGNLVDALIRGDLEP